MKTICVYCAASAEIDKAYFEAAARLGQLIGEHGIRLVNGAGTTGLMRMCADAAMSAGGNATGVIPQFMIDRGWQYDKMTELIVTRDMHERKQTMAQLSDACIAMAGGCGTMEELLEIITWKQMGLYSKPVIILNTAGYYNPLIKMLETAVGQRFMKPEHIRLWDIADTPDDAVRIITEVWNAHHPK
ncbi:MAG: TIGR00730 family Rossman fold protein [Bacteroides sp.]|nr:TIGR00730 family Rossman fold protein [Roseburia sp.]MCM1347146.1 TIGR00730 family Rossman fold protein [Bacteroides sp.]MCM1420610.1 TIGR00730 family Rossman fold protein [Bacteroides sp.]